MKRFVYNKECFDYPEDVDKIVLACNRKGYFISHREAEETWREYSDDMAAGWLCLPSDDEIFNIIKQYCSVVED